MTRIGLLFVLFAAMLSCGSDDSSSSGGTQGAGASGNGGNAGNNGSRSPTGDCSSSSSGSGGSCAGEQEYQDCMMNACDTQYKQCLGDNYQSGSFGGQCQSEITCLMGCSCGDSSCELNCYQSMSEDCKTCFEAADACVNQSGCQEPDCSSNGGSSGAGGSSGSSGNAGASGNGGASGSAGTAGGGGSSTASCPYTADAVVCATACDNLKTIAGKCENDPNLSDEVKTVLGLASQGTGTACKSTCAADSTTHGNQWKCFQGTPSNADCTAIAGCTLANCPGN